MADYSKHPLAFVGVKPQDSEQLDTSHYIFKELFHVRVPYLQTLSPEEIKFFGMPRSMNQQFPHHAGQERILIMIPISKMLDYHRQGAEISVAKYEDTKVIYDHITNHLNAWKAEIRNRMSTAGVPVQDLQDLDQLANALYEHAQYQFTPETVSTLINRMPEKIKLISRASMMLKSKEAVAAEKARKEGAKLGKNVRMASTVVDPTRPVNEPTPEPIVPEMPKRVGIGKFLEHYQSLGSDIDSDFMHPILSDTPRSAQAPVSTSNVSSRSRYFSRESLSYQRFNGQANDKE